MKNQAFDHNRFMKKAIQLAEKSVEKGGGPFGAVIVREGKIVSSGSNCVTLNNDPTAHGEVTAIRKACRKLGTFDLSGCTIYTSCEPCPMCLSAIYWARIEAIYYGCTKEDAKNIGFDDSFIYQQIGLNPSRRKITAKQILHTEALKSFKMWNQKEDRVDY